MPIHQLAPRIVKFQGGAPQFPAHVELCATLGPDELFGEADLSGRLAHQPPGAKLQLKADVFHGGFSAVSKARLQKPHLTAPFFDLTFTLEGKLAKISGTLNNAESLKTAVLTCLSALPGSLACALGAPVVVEDLFGNAGDAFFQVEIKGSFVRIVTSVDPNQAIKKHMEDLEHLPQDMADRVFAAQRYVNQAHWLDYLSRDSQQFSAERLLNLQKALEILYPHGGKIDQLRTTLRQLGLRKEVVECFAAISHVRNTVDVGHPRTAVLKPKQYDTFHAFLLHATQLVTWLINYTIEQFASRTEDPSPSHGASSGDLAKTLSFVEELMTKVNPLQPSTFFDPEARNTPGPVVPQAHAPKSTKKDRSRRKQ